MAISQMKKMFFKVKTINKNKVTTLYIDHAKPIVKNYKFIKGFDEGVLDFYSKKWEHIKFNSKNL